MRALPFDLTAPGIKALVTIQRGLQTLRFTTSEAPITIAGDTWQPGPGMVLTNLQFPSNGAFANADVKITAVAGGIIEPGDAVRGILDGWPISIEMFDSTNLAAGTFDLIKGGVIGQIDEDSDGTVMIAAQGPLARLQNTMTEHYSLTGRESLGDDRCKIPILPADIGRNQAYVTSSPGGNGLQHVNDAFGRVRIGGAGAVEDYQNVFFECTTPGTTAGTAPSYDATVGNTTTDGSAILTARNSWLRYARGHAIDDFHIQLEGLPDSRASDVTWFVSGGLYVRSGELADFPEFPISEWDPVNLIVRLGLPVAPTDIPTGTQFELRPGCDLTTDMCEARFSNIINAREESLVPPPDLATQVRPTAQAPTL